MLAFARSDRQPRWLRALLLATVLLTGRHALAQSDQATAEVLFQQGRDLLRAGKTADACPKLAESQRLDPATGTLLALAMCHEAEGKLATAWAGFVSVEGRARNEGRPDREKVARTRAQALRPRLSKLEIRVPAEVAELAGLQIRRNTVELGPGAWNIAVPVDGGEHAVEVKANGKSPWRATVTVKAASDEVVLDVPPLKDAPKSESAGAAPRVVVRPAEAATSGGWGTLEWTAVGVTGAGAVALGVGGYFLSEALAKKADSDSDCSGRVCGPTGFSQREEARRRGNTATILGVAGGVLAIGGATLFIVGRSKRATDDSAPAPVAFSVSAGPSAFGAQFFSAF